MSEARRFSELDVFRGTAALIVVLYHYIYRFGEFYGHPALDWQWAYLGRYGVHLFFIISGFVIYWSLERSGGLREFMLSRFSRIYPAYWVAVLLTFSIVAWAGLEGRQVGLADMLVNLTMVQEFAGVPHVDYAYWTLTVELTFYALIMCLFTLGQLRHVHRWGAALMLLSIVFHMQWLPAWVAVPWLVQKVLLFKYVQLFTAGILFYRMHTGDPVRGTLPLLLLCMATNLAAYPFVDALLLCGFYGLFLLALGGWLQVFCVRPLLWLGGISYTLYLLHQNIGYVLIQALYQQELPGVVVVVVSLASVLLMAHMLSAMVERPAASWLRRRYGASTTTRSGHAAGSATRPDRSGLPGVQLSHRPAVPGSATAVARESVIAAGKKPRREAAIH